MKSLGEGRVAGESFFNTTGLIDCMDSKGVGQRGRHEAWSEERRSLYSSHRDSYLIHLSIIIFL